MEEGDDAFDVLEGENIEVLKGPDTTVIRSRERKVKHSEYFKSGFQGSRGKERKFSGVHGGSDVRKTGGKKNFLGGSHKRETNLHPKPNK